MPQIIVTAGGTDDLGDTTVMLRERVNTTDFESDRFVTNLLERLGWAVEDATAAEQQGYAAKRDMPHPARRDRRELEPDRDPEPIGAA
jgi:hypothetical protein